MFTGFPVGTIPTGNYLFVLVGLRMNFGSSPSRTDVKELTDWRFRVRGGAQLGTGRAAYLLLGLLLFCMGWDSPGQVLPRPCSLTSSLVYAQPLTQGVGHVQGDLLWLSVCCPQELPFIALRLLALVCTSRVLPTSAGEGTGSKKAQLLPRRGGRRRWCPRESSKADRPGRRRIKAAGRSRRPLVF